MTLVLKVNCRTCNRECGDYKHLLDETVIDEETTTLAALLNYCTTLECFDESHDYSLPEHICNSCIEHLLQCYLFKEMVLQNDKALKDHLKLTLEQDYKELEVAVSNEPFIEQEIDVDGMEQEKKFEAHEDLSNGAAAQSVGSVDIDGSVDEVSEEGECQEVEYEMVEWLEVDEGNMNVKEEKKEELVKAKVDVSTGLDEYILPIRKDQVCGSSSENSNNIVENDAEEREESAFIAVIGAKLSRRRYIKDGNLTEADLTCKYCGKKFDKMCRLREHTYMHTGEKPHVCTVCGKRSRTKTHHNVHMLTHCEVKRYKCSICGQLYRTSNSLRVHERKHSDIKPYSCDICEKAFHTADQRKLHVMLHTGERPFKCNQCDKSYRESSSLKQHILTHGDKKPFQCEVCGKGLTQLSGYKRHMLLHTNEYPFSCSICGRPFRTSSNLLSHTRLHSDTFSYQCSVCNKGFNSASRLKRHAMQHDKEGKEEFKPRKSRQPQEQLLVETKMAKSRVVEIL